MFEKNAKNKITGHFVYIYRRLAGGYRNEFFKFRADAMAFFNREAGKDCVILNSKWDDEEYRNLPPDSDLLAEWREHDRARGG